MTLKASSDDLPQIPWVESEALETRLAASGASEMAKVFARDLARDGLAILDLGDEMPGLCDRIANYVYDFAVLSMSTEHELFDWTWINRRREPYPQG